MIHLNDRAVLKISGTDSHKFLQGLITNDVNKLNDKNAIYAAMQTPQGKYLFDFILYQKDGAILVDVENSCVPDLKKKLGVYKLRADVKIEDINYQVYSDQSQGIVDPRDAKLGKRLITAEKQIADGSFNDYEKNRLELGIPDSKDFIPERSFISQNNFEALNGIDYNKGCYVGQEVVARVKYKGNVTRRIFKVKGVGRLPEFGANIMYGEKIIGEIRSSLGDIGLAQCLVEATPDVEYNAGGQAVKLKMPDYLMI